MKCITLLSSTTLSLNEKVGGHDISMNRLFRVEESKPLQNPTHPLSSPPTTPPHSLIRLPIPSMFPSSQYSTRILISLEESGGSIPCSDIDVFSRHELLQGNDCKFVPNFMYCTVTFSKTARLFKNIIRIIRRWDCELAEGVAWPRA